MAETIAQAALSQVIPESTTVKGSAPNLKDLAKGFIASLGTTAVVLKGFEEAYRHTTGQGLSPYTYILTFIAWFGIITLRQYLSGPDSERMFDVTSLRGVSRFLHTQGEHNDADIVSEAATRLESKK